MGSETKLPPHLEEQRTRIFCGKDAPTHARSNNFSGAYRSLGEDHSFDNASFKENFRIDIKRMDSEVMEFDMIGVDASIANAFRRILIADVPTMAIEKVFIANNSSIMQDEVLAHRLGLIPLRVDAKKFDYRTEDEAATEQNTIVFRLKMKCSRLADGRLENDAVLSEHLEWLPAGSELPEDSDSKFTHYNRDQSEFYGEPIACADDKIVINKMRPGQEIELEAHAVKGEGKTHAKWSPVATAFYRLLPEVTLKQEITGEEAHALKKKCPKDVFDIEDIGGTTKATVVNARACTICRECIREPGAENFVDLKRVKDHFIFTIESAGQYHPRELFIDAIGKLRLKCQKMIQLTH
ncbi:hypothetical protein CYMTET_6991 [Cymbomonas tetramitiformis]|uniref:DNA-directed RNA polymerases I and III subunit RPAC1 n=1 Tax=Cymbomonas tetramitiformis TaxID=36881 RepID=A0AAE0LHG8_9CHLO|nr:hypothetical protein CYMTET_6991 [Cymbomonas tetramitiformis]